MAGADIRPGIIRSLDGTQHTGAYSFHPVSDKYDPTATDMNLSDGRIGTFEIPGPGEILDISGVLFFRPVDAAGDAQDIQIA